MSRKGAWDLFRRVRIFIFVFCIILSFGCFTVFSIYSSKNFGQYDIAKRVFMISLLTGYAIAGTFLYLALVVKFHLWTEVARISIYILLTIVGAAFYSFVGRTYPCNLGSVAVCNDLSLSLVIATWSLSCLLAVYACYLGIMSFIPQPLLPVETKVTLGSPQLSTDLVPLESKDSGTDVKFCSEEACPLTPLKGSKAEKHTPPSISVTPPPSYETASNSALFAQFPVPPVQRSPQFSPGLPPPSRPLPLPNPFSNRLIERSPSATSSIPSSVASYWGPGFQRQRSLTLNSQSTFSSPSLLSSTTRSDRNTGSSPGPRHPSLLTPATIPRSHFRFSPTPPVPPDFYRVGPETPRSFVSLPLPAAMPSYRDERQWANWHYPGYDTPRSASASVFSHHTTSVSGNSASFWR